MQEKTSGAALKLLLQSASERWYKKVVQNDPIIRVIET